MSSLNRTGRSNPRLLFFNRPTKVGSTTFVHWLLRLSSYGRGNPRAHKEVDNDFDFFFYSDSRQDPNTDHERTLMTPEEERETANYISRQACPPGRACSFYKHMFFVDYENFNLTNPIYVSLVRHPVDRQISWSVDRPATETPDLILTRKKCMCHALQVLLRTICKVRQQVGRVDTAKAEGFPG